MTLTTKRLCRAGVIAALYAACCYVFAPLSFGFIQIRPSEALCLLPLFYAEAVPALFLGCALANLTSPFFLYDVLLGSTVTLLAALATYFLGKTVRKTGWKIALGGLFPVLLNAFLIPVILVFLCGQVGENGATVAYFSGALSIGISEALCVYAIGTPLVLSIARLRERGVKSLL